MGEQASVRGATEAETTVVGLDERAWLPRHCRGDAAAFAELVGAYRTPVYGYLVRCGVPPAARDDLFQETFLRIHAAAGSYQPSRPLRPWLFTILANLVRNYFRDRAQQLLQPDPAASDPSDPGPGPQQGAELDQTLGWLEQAIAALPLAQREVLVLAAIQELPQQEVADTLQMPVATVKTHLRRARLHLLEAKAYREQQEDTDGGL